MSLVVASLFVSNSVLAADKSWTGLKIGIGAGGSSSQADTTNSASHNFNENDIYQTISDDEDVNTFGPNNKFDPTTAGTQNGYLGGTGVLHGSIDKDITPDNDSSIAPGNLGTNYYDRNYQISEIFKGQAFDKLDLGKAGAFGTLDITYDWQISDQFVIGLTGSANFTGNQNANGAASGGNEARWTEFLSYTTLTNTDNSGNSDLSTNDTSVVTNNNPTGPLPGSSYGQTAYTGMKSSFETQNSFDLGARFGFLPTNNTLVFVSGGFSTMKVRQKTTYQSSATINDQNSIYGDIGLASNSYNFETTKSDSEYKPGYFLGAGIETRMTDTISLKLEYRYADYGTIKSRSSSNNAAILDGTTGNDFEFYNSLGGSYNLSQKTELTAQSIRAVLSYNF